MNGNEYLACFLYSLFLGYLSCVLFVGDFFTSNGNLINSY